jgi:hypothetical protein
MAKISYVLKLIFIIIFVHPLKKEGAIRNLRNEKKY